MIRKTLTLFIFSISLISCAFGQKQVGIAAVNVEAEKNINIQNIESIAFNLLNASTNDSAFYYNDLLKSTLKNELNKKEALRHSFNGIESISILSPQDSNFILFNWNIPLNNGKFKFECGILNRDPKSKLAFDFLKDTTFQDRITEEHSTTMPNYWSPCLFYKIIETKTQFQTYYTLLFWDGNNRLTNKKGIDVLWFDKSNSARFGAPIFSFNSEKAKSRIVFEYGGQNRMKLQCNEGLNRIEFDHLSPPPADEQNTTSLEGVYEYYGPDLSFDGFVWNKKSWVYNADIDLDEGIKKKEKDFVLDEDVKQEEIPMYKPN